ncbi:MAG TPA: NADH-ubiquinone oxidoreductase-F iron-sulfur binding region domain-containing protein [Chloroflexota bacterium]
MSARARLASLVEAARGHGRSRARLVVASGGCSLARGAAAVVAALRSAVQARGLDVTVVEGGCNGMCYANVLVDVQMPDRPRVTYGGVTAETADRLVAQVVARGQLGALPGGFVWSESGVDGLPSYREVPFLAGQRRLLLRDVGAIDPNDVDDYLLQGGYATLARALDEMAPEDIIGEVKTANLIGRGGAYFPTAVKWQGCRSAKGEPKWVVVNAEEGEPGVFKDRHLLEGDPHRVLEGMLLAAYAVGASRGVFYMNGEARHAQRCVHRAVEQARALGLIGERVLGSDFSFEVEIRHGSGGYILGEETALLESIEGKRAMPRVRPPFPVESGLWGKPTLINNAETLATIRTVLEMGGAAFARLGVPNGTGTKLIGLSGNVARPGLAEVEFGTTMGQLVEGIGGGVPDGRALKAVLIGGPSGVLVPASAVNEPIQPRGAVPPGTGGWVVLDDRQSVVEIVRQLTHFNMVESCGKCTPCREGTARLVAILDRVAEGAGTAADLEELRGLAEVVGFASLCGLGQMAPNPINSALQHFEGEFRAKVHA